MSFGEPIVSELPRELFEEGKPKVMDGFPNVEGLYILLPGCTSATDRCDICVLAGRP